MEFKYVGFEVDEKFSETEVRLSVKPSKFERKEDVGIYFTGLKLLPGKIYHFEFHAKINGLDLGPDVLFLDVAEQNHRNIVTNASYDVFERKWVYHWRACVSAKECHEVSLLVQPKYYSSALTIIHARRMTNCFQILPFSSATVCPSFAAFHSKGIYLLDPFDEHDDIEKYFSFVKSLQAKDLTRVTTVNAAELSLVLREHAEEKDSKKMLGIMVGTSLLFHSDFDVHFTNVAAYLVDLPLDVMLWSTFQVEHAEEKGFSCASPVAKFVRPCGPQLSRDHVVSLSPVGAAVLLRNLHSLKHFGNALQQTINLCATKGGVKGSVYFAAPALFGTRRNCVSRQGIYDLPPPNNEVSTKVSVFLVIDECIIEEKEIEESIKSISTQTYKNLEIILVDFAGTFTKSISKATLLAADLRIKLVTVNPKISWLENMVTLVQECKGNYLLFQHAKMISSPQRISNQLRALVLSEKIKVVSCERGLKTKTSSVAYADKIKSQVNGYELGLYKKELFRNLSTGSSEKEIVVGTKISEKDTPNYSLFMCMLFNYVVGVRGKYSISGLDTAMSSTLEVDLKDTVLKYSQFDFYLTLPNIFVLQ